MGILVALLIIVVPLFLFLFAVGFGMKMIGILFLGGMDKIIEGQQAKEAQAATSADA